MTKSYRYNTSVDELQLRTLIRLVTEEQERIGRTTNTTQWWQLETLRMNLVRTHKGIK